MAHGTHGTRRPLARFPSLLYLRFVGPGQQFGDGIGNHDRAVTSFVSHDETDVAGWPADAVPGQPKAVRRAHLRLAEMPRQPFGGENKLFFRPLIRKVFFLRVKRIDNHGPIHGDRFRIVGAIKVNAATKPPHGGFALLVHDGVGPKADDLLRRDRFAFRFPPRKRRQFDFGQVERRATGQP